MATREARQLLQPYAQPIRGLDLVYLVGILCATFTSYAGALLCIWLGGFALIFCPIFVFAAGACLWGLWTLGHDYLHGATNHSASIESVLGSIALIPTLFPFLSTKILHLGHHSHLNNSYKDTAWNPWPRRKFLSSSPLVKKIYFFMRGRFWWLGPLFFLFVRHYDLRQIPKRHTNKLYFNIMTIILYISSISMTAYLFTGLGGLFILFASHAVFSTIFAFLTLMQHTNPRVLGKNSWHSSSKEGLLDPLAHTVDYSCPRWMQSGVFWNGNLHTPHHLCPKIPFYLIADAQQALKNRLPHQIHETSILWSDLKFVLQEVNLFDEKSRILVGFDAKIRGMDRSFYEY